MLALGRSRSLAFALVAVVGAALLMAFGLGAGDDAGSRGPPGWRLRRSARRWGRGWRGSLMGSVWWLLGRRGSRAAIGWRTGRW